MSQELTLDAMPDHPDWYAIVKYKSDGQTEIVPVTSIRKKTKKHNQSVKSLFNPTTKTDFKFAKLYSVWTSLGVRDGTATFYNAYIGRIEG